MNNTCFGKTFHVKLLDFVQEFFTFADHLIKNKNIDIWIQILHKVWMKHCPSNELSQTIIWKAAFKISNQPLKYKGKNYLKPYYLIGRVNSLADDFSSRIETAVISKGELTGKIWLLHGNMSWLITSFLGKVIEIKVLCSFDESEIWKSSH